MKNLIFVLCLIIGLSTVIKADSWALPTTEKYCSENKKYCLKVEPKKLESQLSYFQDKVNERENAGAAKNVKENFCKGTFYAKGKKLWSVKLDNEVSPVSGIVSNNGDYVITFDNWHGTGYGDNVVAIYDAANGNLIKKLGLSDFLIESDIHNLPHSTSSIQWSGEHKIDYGKKQLVLKVAKSGRNNPDYFDVRLDLTNGAVLDEIIDRLPSLQFLLSTKEEAEKETSYTIKSETALCRDTKNLTKLSTSELNKKIISKSMPEYPPAARAVRAIGESVFEIVISEDGDVECINPISGHPLLRTVLINSMKNWKFEKSQTKYTGSIVIEGKSVLILNGTIID